MTVSFFFLPGSTDFFSAISSEGDDEFFDLEDEELNQEFQAILKNVVTSESDSILELFREVDELLEGSSGDQQKAMNKLREHEAEVSRGKR